MAVGDVTVWIFGSPLNLTQIAATIQFYRRNANSKWLICNASGGQQVIIVQIEEA